MTDSTSPAESAPAAPPAPGNPNPLLALWKAMTSFRTAVVLLALCMLLVLGGTFAQVHEGLYLAQERWFKSWFIFRQAGDPWWVPPFFPGGYLLGTLFLINMVCSHFRRFTRPPGGMLVMIVHYLIVLAALYGVTVALIMKPLIFTGVLAAIGLADGLMSRFLKLGSSRKLGVDLSHFGIAVLMIGQLFTDMTAVESNMAFTEGETRDYTQHHMDFEIFAETDKNEKNETVVAFPQDMLEPESELKHDQLPFVIRVKEWHLNGALVNRTEAIEAEQQLRAAMATMDARYADPATLPELAKSAAENPEHVSAWREALRGMGLDGTLSTDAAAKFLADKPAEAKQFLERLRTAFRERMTTRFRMSGSETALAAEHLLSGTPLSATEPPVQGTQGAATRGYLVKAMPEQRTMNGRNLSWAVVEVLEGGKSLGTWLLHPELRTQEVSTAAGKWRIGTRFERYYHPFSVTLLKAQHLKYAGTEIPKDYRSQVRLRNPARNEDREVDIYMNHPLRYQYRDANDRLVSLALYQQQMGMGGPENAPRGFSQLQVVDNSTWFTPYFGCIVVGYGLTRHFLLHLLTFSRRRTAAAANA